MQVVKTKLGGVLLMKPRVFSDDRGFFLESYNKSVLAGAGIHHHFLENRIMRNLQAFNYEIHQKPYRDNPVHGKYVNNFIFKPIV